MCAGVVIYLHHNSVVHRDIKVCVSRADIILSRAYITVHHSASSSAAAAALRCCMAPILFSAHRSVSCSVVKVENLMLRNDQDFDDILLIDFGMAVMCEKGHSLTRSVCSGDHVAHRVRMHQQCRTAR